MNVYQTAVPTTPPLAALPGSTAASLTSSRDPGNYGTALVNAFARPQRPVGTGPDLPLPTGQLLSSACPDRVWLRRCMANIAADNRRDYVFHLFEQGGIEVIEGLGFARCHAPLATIVALDMAQPVTLKRTACQALTFSAPRQQVEAILPHAEALHGCVLQVDSLPARRLLDYARTLSAALPNMSAVQTASAFDQGLRQLLAAFGKQGLVYGNSRAAGRCRMFGDARRYVQTHLHQPWLSPERVMKALQLPRATLYRLFEHEGGLATYIRTCRLREAGDLLIRHPERQVTEIAYGLGFNSASDFTRAFRRGHGISPQDHRQRALLYLRERRHEDWLIEQVACAP